MAYYIMWLSQVGNFQQFVRVPHLSVLLRIAGCQGGGLIIIMAVSIVQGILSLSHSKVWAHTILMLLERADRALENDAELFKYCTLSKKE